MAFVGFALVVLILLLRRTAKKKILIGSIIYGYIALVLGITLFPLPYSAAPSMIPAENNVIPFATITRFLRYSNLQGILTQIGGNILLAVPYGALLFALLKSRKAWAVFLLLLAFPVVIELLQLGIGWLIGGAYRSFDVDDIILNTLGGGLGYLFGRLFLPKLRNKLLGQDNF